MIGVHAPEFSFEHDAELVRNATWWMVLGWPLLIVFAVSPWPWW